MARTVTVVVASVSPLQVTFPGDAPGIGVPVVNRSGLTLTVGERVTVTVRSPLLPQITGRVT